MWVRVGGLEWRRGVGAGGEDGEVKGKAARRTTATVCVPRGIIDPTAHEWRGDRPLYPLTHSLTPPPHTASRLPPPPPSSSPLLSFPEDPVTEARHTEGPRSERYQGPSWCRVGVES